MGLHCSHTNDTRSASCTASTKSRTDPTKSSKSDFSGPDPYKCESSKSCSCACKSGSPSDARFALFLEKLISRSAISAWDSPSSVSAIYTGSNIDSSGSSTSGDCSSDSTNHSNSATTVQYSCCTPGAACGPCSACDYEQSSCPCATATTTNFASYGGSKRSCRVNIQFRNPRTKRPRKI